MIARTNGHHRVNGLANGRLKHVLSGESPPPSDQEAERAALGSLMIDPAQLPAVSQIIGADDFYGPQHRKIWSAMGALASRGEPVDARLLCDELKRRGDLDEVGVGYLEEVVESVPTASNAIYYAGVVRRHAEQRRLIDAGRDVVEAGRAVMSIGADGSYSDDERSVELERAVDGVRKIVNGLCAAPREPDESPLTELSRPFPTLALPEAVRGLVAAGAAAIGCDPAYIAMPLLAVLGAAIGNSRRIRLKKAWSEPAIIWSAIVGNSGTVKSPALDLALRPVRALQAKSFAFMGKTPPTRYLTNDATIEAIAGLLQKQPRGLLLASDELSGWLRSHDAYKSGRSGDTAKWLELHGGRALTIDRKSVERPVIFIPNASVSITGGIQPEILRACLGREHLFDGLAARLLMGWPPRTVKRWREADVSDDTSHCIDLVVQRLYWLEPATDEAGEPYPKPIGLSVEGKRTWVDWYNHFAVVQQALSAELASAAAKIEGYAARLSLIVHCVRQVADELPADAPIDEASVAAGVAIAEWCWGEAQRIYRMLNESPAQTEQRELVELILGAGGRITPRELWRRSRKYRPTEKAQAALDALIAKGLGCWRDSPVGAHGGRPSPEFVLFGDGDKTPKNTANGEVLSPSPLSPGEDLSPGEV